MDIQQWLEDTADREPPGRSDDIDIPETFRKDRPKLDQAGAGYRYKRKRASRDSSIIAPKRGHHWKDQASTRAPSSDHVRAADDADTGLRRKDSKAAPSSSQRDAPRQTYERKARHKTRPDRYEPKARKQKTARDTRKRKKNPKRRKSHRIDDGGRTTGLVQSFQLKNGPKNNRLTLKPDTSAGLFKHGRASVQMIGRGGGLPDLTFNEMRFLQRPTEHQDDSTGADESHNPRTKGPRLDQGEEISAYFNARSAITAKRADSLNDRAKKPNRDDEPTAQSKRSKEVDPKQTLVELPDKPFLGFGSKGTQPMSNGIKNDNARYYTWSDSAHQPSSPPSNRQVEIKEGQFEAGRGWDRNDKLGVPRGEYEIAHAKTGVPQYLQDPNKDDGAGTWIQTGRRSGPARVEVYQPADSRMPKHRDSTSAIQNTSQSLPRHPSSPPQLHVREPNKTLVGTCEPPSYHTSDILKIRGRPMEDGYSSFQFHLLTSHMDQDKENQSPGSSLSIDKALRRARAAVQTQDFAMQPSIQVQIPDVRSLPNIRRISSINDLPKTHQVDPTYRKRRPGLSPLQLHFVRPVQALWQSPLHHRPQLATEDPQWETEAMETIVPRTLRTSHVQEAAYIDEDEEVLENAIHAQPTSIFSNGASASRRYEANVPHDLRFTPRSSVFEVPVSGSGNRRSVSAFSEHKILERRPERGLSIEHDRRGEMVIDHHADQMDEELAGFWRPNRLY